MKWIWFLSLIWSASFFDYPEYCYLKKIIPPVVRGKFCMDLVINYITFIRLKASPCVLPQWNNFLEQILDWQTNRFIDFYRAISVCTSWGSPPLSSLKSDLHFKYIFVFKHSTLNLTFILQIFVQWWFPHILRTEPTLSSSYSLPC